MRAIVVVTFIAVAALLTGCGTRRGGSPASATERAMGVVRTVIDGDTVDVDIIGRTERIRLIGVDTPETKKPGTPVECFGPDASAYTMQLLPPDTAVRLVRDIVPRDDYGRLLAYVFRLPDGLFVNDALLRNGYGRSLTIAPNDTYRPILSAAASAARSTGAGLWSHCDGAE
jgi:micrococcal nuclease